MIRIKYVLILITLFFSRGAYSEVIKLNDLFEVQSIIDKSDINTLIVFDIDYTFITPKDLVLRPNGRTIRHEIMGQIKQSMGVDYLIDHHSLITLQAQTEIVEPDTSAYIHELQSNGYKVIALTAMGTSRFGLIESQEDLRIND